MTQEDKLFQVRKSSISYWGRVRAVSNSSRKNKAAGPKRKLCSVADVSDGESKVQCYKNIIA